MYFLKSTELGQLLLIKITFDTNYLYTRPNKQTLKYTHIIRIKMKQRYLIYFCYRLLYCSSIYLRMYTVLLKIDLLIFYLYVTIL